MTMGNDWTERGLPIDELLRARAAASEERLSLFREAFAKNLDRKDILLGDHTTLYATGSGGRREMSPYSDLDVFLVRRGKPAKTLDAVEIQAAIIKTLREVGFPPPSRDGEFLRMHTAERLVANIGKPEDDAENTFTARMLLLLESAPVASTEAYRAIVDDVISAYWKNADLHPEDYLPIVLVNDIVRYWRILLLNYESKNTEKRLELSPERAKADLRLRSYKLRLSRCITCYSLLIAFLGAAKRKGHVGRADVLALVTESPTDRIARVERDFVDTAAIAKLARGVRERYADFLAWTVESKESLEQKFEDAAFRRARLAEGDAFGEAVFSLVAALGQDNRLYRYMVV